MTHRAAAASPAIAAMRRTIRGRVVGPDEADYDTLRALMYGGLDRQPAAIVRVAADYDVPLWNFWLAVQPLPGHGLTEDAFHLSYARNFFDDPVRMQSAWPVRNLTALQSLEAVWQAVK